MGWTAALGRRGSGSGSGCGSDRDIGSGGGSGSYGGGSLGSLLLLFEEARRAARHASSERASGRRRHCARRCSTTLTRGSLWKEPRPFTTLTQRPVETTQSATGTAPLGQHSRTCGRTQIAAHGHQLATYWRRNARLRVGCSRVNRTGRSRSGMSRRCATAEQERTVQWNLSATVEHLLRVACRPSIRIGRHQLNHAIRNNFSNSIHIFKLNRIVALGNIRSVESVTGTEDRTSQSTTVPSLCCTLGHHYHCPLSSLSRCSTPLV